MFVYTVISEVITFTISLVLTNVAIVVTVATEGGAGHSSSFSRSKRPSLHGE